jgi:DNA primase
MDSKKAKEISLEEILLSLGYEPVKSNGDELLYHSPFRNEQVPSFFVNRSKNIFNDFGDDSGENVLEFIMTYYDISDVSSALRKLEEICGSPREKMRPVVGKTLVSSESKENNLITIFKVQSLQNNALIQYLEMTLAFRF